MKLTFVRKKSRGFSLLIVFVIVAVALMILAGVMGWVASNGALSGRFREYHTSLGAAEAATEKVIASMGKDFMGASERSDFQGADLTTLDGNIATYQGQYPLSGDLSGAPNYEFAGPTLGTDATYVARVADRGWTNLTWKYTNFNGYAATYRVVSNARNTDSENNITSGFRQDVQLASIPVFGFGIFYSPDLEFCPSAGNFTITGPVHSNGSIYSKPNSPASITYTEAVTASGTITNESGPLDPTPRTLGTVVYDKEKDVRVSPLNLPIGLPNTSTNLHQIIEIPAVADAGTPLGRQRYYNKADLIIRVTDDLVTYYLGSADPFPHTESVTNLVWGTNVIRIDGGSSFYNLREAGISQGSIRFTEVDVNRLTTPPFTTSVGHTPISVYIADLRTNAPGSESGIRLTNGLALPASGLTIATPNPLYVIGNFNTSTPRPASLVADAITVLSGNWNDAISATSYAQAAANTTINAGVIAGIVPSDGTAYSGGVENVLRFLEDWSSRTFTLNGSIVVLFSSQIAKAPWGAINVYTPPSRVFSFDPAFTDSTTLPSGTPYVRTLIRDQRIAIQSNSTY